MAATKNSRPLRTSASLPAATLQSATELNLSTAYGALINILITNGASAPTTAPKVVVYTGEATGKKTCALFTASGDTVNNSVTSIPVRIPAPGMFINIDLTGGATNASTAEIFAQELTTV